MSGDAATGPEVAVHRIGDSPRGADGWCRRKLKEHPRVISILQPVYLPWLGYFEQMALADLFVSMDDVPYTRHDWRNRNRVRVPDGWTWLTVPVLRHHRWTEIREIEINRSTSWERRHLRTLESNYRKCKGFEPLISRLRSVYARRDRLLVDLDLRLAEILADLLDVTTPVRRSSDVPLREDVRTRDRNGRIIDICHFHGASILYDGAKAADFIDLERFRRAGIEVVFQDYRHPEYPQRWAGFESHLSAVDLIMNVGGKAPEVLRSSPFPQALGGSEFRSANR